MAIIKKVIKNKPFLNAHGQYSFDGNINLGLYPVFNDKFIHRDLYTTSETSDVNEAILAATEIITLEDDSHLTIDNLTVVNSGVSHKLNNIHFRVYIVDSNNFAITDDASYEDIAGVLDLNVSFKIYDWYPGTAGENWSPPNPLIEGGAIFTNLFIENGLTYNTDYTAYPTSAIVPNYSISNLNSTLGVVGLDALFAEDHLIYVIVRMDGDADRWFGTDDRDSRIQIFSIPVNDIISAQQEVSFNLEYSEPYTGGGGGVGAETAAFQVSVLNVRVSRGFEQTIPLPESLSEFENQLDFPLFISNDNYEGIVEAKPNRIIDWSTNQQSIDFDFYLGTTITVLDNTDIQSYYTDDDDKFKASTPTTIDLKFNINKKILEGELLEYIPVGDEENTKFKFFVLDWDDKENKLTGWDSVFNFWPKTMDDFINNQQDNTFKFGEIIWNGYYWENIISLTNSYQTSGIKTIKAIFFSYLDSEDATEFQIIRWKLATIRIYLGNAKVYLEDFSDIGGPDFVTLPWPYTTAIISGISEKSQYIQSIKNVLAAGNLSDIDVIDSTLLLNAKENDELGDYLGDTDIEQTRVFNKPYDMNRLLNLVVYGCDHIEYCSGDDCFQDEWVEFESGFDCNRVISHDYAVDGIRAVCRDDTTVDICLYDPSVPFCYFDSGDFIYFSGYDACRHYPYINDVIVGSYVEEIIGTGATDDTPTGELIDLDPNLPFRYRTSLALDDDTPLQLCKEVTGNEFISYYEVPYWDWLPEDDKYWYYDTNLSSWIEGDYQGYSIARIIQLRCYEYAYLHPYSDGTYWDLDGDGIGNTFPTESCVGQIFINDNMDPLLREACIIELNAQELEGDIVRDSSGNGNKGILIGDYKIDKPSKDVPIRRKSDFKISEKDTTNGAI